MKVIYPMPEIVGEGIRHGVYNSGNFPQMELNVKFLTQLYFGLK